ncbi:MAG: hypothetical protein ACREPS_04225 [Rhodanobacteraceae bacterium]
MTGNARDDTPPTLAYWRVWVDDEGISHQDRRNLAGFERQSMGGAAQQWNAVQPAAPRKTIFTVLPVGWTGDWHENPEPQWIVPLSGRWFVETMDGHRVERGAGDVSFGGDQGCVADANVHKGHCSARWAMSRPSLCSSKWSGTGNERL